MPRTLLVIPFLLLALGCGDSAAQRQAAAENYRRAQELEERRLKEIADDASLSEADAIRKYLDQFPTVPKNLPADVAPGWAANQRNNQWHLVIHAVLQAQYANSSADERMRKERNTVRWHMAGCKRMLDHLGGRKVQSVTVVIYTQLTGQDKHTELFRAVMTRADLPKVEQAAELPAFESANNPATAAEGTVYDPRGPKIGDCWTVELNRYPDLEYKKR
jgi:hypothetical protein